MKKWFEIRAKAESLEAEILLFGEIGMWGITAKDFTNELKELGPRDRYIVRINSPGGDVFEGAAIYNALRRLKGDVEVHVDGLAASMASVIAMAGDKIVMGEASMMMIHNPWSFAIGEAEDMRKQADVLDKVKASILKAYTKRSGKSEEDVSALMDAETWLTAEEAVAEGFADEVDGDLLEIEEEARAALRFDAKMLERFQSAPQSAYALAEMTPPAAEEAPAAEDAQADSGEEAEDEAKPEAEDAVPPAPVAAMQTFPEVSEGEIQQPAAVAGADMEPAERPALQPQEPENPVQNKASGEFSAKDAAAIVKMGIQHGCPDIAADLIEAGVSLETAKAKMESLSIIRGFVETAQKYTHVPNDMAASLIREGVSSEQAAARLLKMMAQNEPEIDAAVPPTKPVARSSSTVDEDLDPQKIAQRRMEQTMNRTKGDR
jgi:ATP-dependent Clp endopeptidase proteolytic subunit ClpP